MTFGLSCSSARRAPWRGAMWAVGVLVGLSAGCGAQSTADDTATEAASAPLTVERWLYGSGKSCRMADECDTGACYLSQCAGLLNAGAFWAQDRVLATWEVRGTAEQRQTVVGALQALFASEDSLDVERLRALHALARIGGEDAREALRQGVRTGSAPVAQLARILLAEGGDAAAADELAAGLEAHSDVSAALAAGAYRKASSEQAGLAAALAAYVVDAAHPASARLAATAALSARADVPGLNALDECLEGGDTPFLQWPVAVAVAARRRAGGDLAP